MFRLPREAESWFSGIRKEFSLEFDIYYFCLMAGLAKRETDTIPTSETKDVINRFPQEYRAEAKIIISLFLKTELNLIGINLKDRKAVNETIRNYVETGSPTHLSDEGEKQINKYVNRGLQVLKEYFNDKPRTLEVFLLRFAKMINELNDQQKAS